MSAPRIESAKPGALICFVCGPGESHEPKCCQRIGKAYGLIRDPRWGNSLRVKFPDGSFTRVSSFTTVGIGAYLVEK